MESAARFEFVRDSSSCLSSSCHERLGKQLGQRMRARLSRHLLLLLAALDSALCLALGVSWRTSTPLVLRPGAAGAAVARMSAAPASLVAGFESIADRYDGFILDQFGVMHNGVVALPGAQECFQKLAKAGKKLVILSNTSRRAVSASRPSHSGSRRLWNSIVLLGACRARVLVRARAAIVDRRPRPLSQGRRPAQANAQGKLPGMGFDTEALSGFVTSGEEVCPRDPCAGGNWSCASPVPCKKFVCISLSWPYVCPTLRSTTSSLCV